MKTARYFEEHVLRKRPYIQCEWCERALREAVHREIQPDGCIRHTDLLYIDLSERTSVDSREVTPGVVLDVA